MINFYPMKGEKKKKFVLALSGVAAAAEFSSLDRNKRRFAPPSSIRVDQSLPTGLVISRPGPGPSLSNIWAL